MKNQYFADVNDYRKYGLLRCLAGANGLRAGICWMLTEADDRSDGKFVEYWVQPERWRRHDPELFDALSQCRTDLTLRHVEKAEEWALVPGAVYYNRLLSDSASSREAYFAAAWEALGHTEIIFFDPDTGLEVPSIPYGTRNSSKYLYWREAEAAFARGHSVLIYQHFQRKSRASLIRDLAEKMRARTSAAAVYSFSTPHVLFLLAAQARHLLQLRRTDAYLRDRWTSQILPDCHHALRTAALPGENW